MLAGLKQFIVDKGSYAGYLGLILLVIIALMNIVHNLTYLRPTDGAVWELRDGDCWRLAPAFDLVMQLSNLGYQSLAIVPGARCPGATSGPIPPEPSVEIPQHRTPVPP